MKKNILALFLVGFLLVPGLSFAQVVGDVDPNPIDTGCVALQNNLRYKDRDVNKNGEVSTLQDFLQSKNYLSSEQTGYFGLLTLLTQKAVKSFQKDNNISPTGYVGPVTRAKIKALTCGGDTTTPSITVLSPNGGETYTYGQSVVFKWKSSNLYSAGVTGELIGVSNPDNDYSLFGESNGGSLNNGQETINFGPTINPGTYKFKVSKFNDSISDSSDNYFTITSSIDTGLPPGCTSSTGYSSTTGQSCGCNGTVYSTYSGQLCPNYPTLNKPVISGVSGPQTLNVNQTGTWKVTASDSNNGNLSYSVVWGDEGTAYPSPAVSYLKTLQSATFTHSYSKAGIYSPKFTVTNESGGSANTSVSVNVGNVVSVNHNPVINPIVLSSDERIQVGQSANFNFSATDADNDNLSWAVEWGDGNAEGDGSSCNGSYFPRSDSSKFSVNHIWKQTGTYPVRIIVTDCKGEPVRSSFNVTVGSTTSTPSVTVTANPAWITSGELCPNGNTIASNCTTPPSKFSTISWSATNNPTSCYMTGVGSVQSTGGTKVVYPTATTTYTVTCSNSSGTGTESVTVKVGVVTTPSITVLSPNKDSIISSPLTVSGYVTAESKWGAFEGYVGQVKLIDSNGVVLDTKPLLMIKDNYTYPIYFSATLNFDIVLTKGTISQGTLVFTNENPSGLDSNNKEYRLPVKFGNLTISSSITVLSPNGGEKYTTSQEIPVKYKSSGIRTGNVAIGYKNISSGKEEFQMIAPNTGLSSLRFVPVGSYKVIICDTVVDPTAKYEVGYKKDCTTFDYSDNYFTISAPVVKDINLVSLNSALKLQSANVLGALDNSSDQKKSETKLDESVDNSQGLICKEFTMTLKKGMKNEEVKCLQKMLNEKGFKVEGVEKGMETNYFGPATLAAFKKFQASNNLEVDGVFGSNSRAVLNVIVQ